MTRHQRPLLALLAVLPLVFAACGGAPAAPEFPEIVAYDPPDDAGKTIRVDFTLPTDEFELYARFLVERQDAEGEPFHAVKEIEGTKPRISYPDESTTLDSTAPVTGKDYWYRVMAYKEVCEVVLADLGPFTATEDGVELEFALPAAIAGKYEVLRLEQAEEGKDAYRLVVRLAGAEAAHKVSVKPETRNGGAPEQGKAYVYRVRGVVSEEEILSSVSGPAAAAAEWWDFTKLAVFFAIVVFAALVFAFNSAAKRNPDIYVRPIGGLGALSEAIGRATEMGKPVLFVPGIADMDDIQTITALVIMREVAKNVAEYETPIIVPCRSPVVMTAAEEAVKTGCMEAGKPDQFTPDNIRFLSDEQFAFTAATNGIMLRERPAANIYIGAFWAESLILAETGFLAGAIQIAGTANVSQLPFFVAACDYTLIGEEIYAASAYLSREPMLMGSLKGSDWAKVIFAVLIVLGTVFASQIGPDKVIWKGFIAFFK